MNKQILSIILKHLPQKITTTEKAYNENINIFKELEEGVHGVFYAKSSNCIKDEIFLTRLKDR